MTDRRPSSGKSRTIPTVSRAFDDGTLVELIYSPSTERTSLAVRHADGRTSVEPIYKLSDGRELAPYSAQNPLLTSRCVLLPSDIGELRDKGDIITRIKAFLGRYVALSPAFTDIAPYYVLLTWVYDAFRELPMLRFRGDYGTGKTRALMVMGSLCYKPFFASGASTVSPIFHILDAFRGTLVLDEADFRFSDATAELTKILNNGTVDGLPVLRTMTNRDRELHPQAFRVFGPKLIAMRKSFSDDALESRFVTEETGGRPLPAHIPIHLPDTLHTEAAALRNSLLAWRFAARHTVAPNPERLLPNAEPRLNQTALALLSLVDDADTRARIAHALVTGYAPLQEDRSEKLEALMLDALVEQFGDDAPSAKVADVARMFNARAADRLSRAKSNKWVGWFLRKRLHLSTMKSGGVYVVPGEERQRVMALAARAGVGDSERAS